MLDMTEVFEEFMTTYVKTRYVITNTFTGETKVGTPGSVYAYIHPDDYKKDVYNAQGQRLEDRIKIFVYLDADILNDDEVVYQGRTYKVSSDNAKIVGNYKKLLADLVK